MRIPGFAGEVVSKLGVNVTNIAPGELYTALDRGTIDALEWVGPSLDLRMGFHKVAPYYYTGWHEPATELQFLINRKFMDKLPADLQEIIKVAMKTASYDMLTQSNHESGKNWATMKKEFPNIKVKTFPESVMTAIKKANDDLLVEKAAKDPLAKEILDSQANYIKQIRPWTLLSDYSYLKSLEEK
jgi:TRAP-type mannitol/chloroaromatic compound transport system substrate-binding protein